MNLQQQIGPMLLSAYRDQNVAQLKEWFNRFPEAINILTKAVGEAPLKAASAWNAGPLAAPPQRGRTHQE